MPKPRRHFFDTDYGQMHFRMSRPENGSRPTLICLHMSPQSGGAFSKFMTDFSSDRMVVAPDYHGFGESDRPPATPHVTIRDYARTIWQALEYLDVGTVDLLGHHTGSKVAAEMAYQRPERVRKIVMISGSVMDASEFKKLNNTSKFQPIPIDADGTRIKSLWDNMRQFLKPEFPLDVLSNFVLDALRAGDAYQWGNRAAFLYNETFVDVLNTLEHQVTVINPKDDLYDVKPGMLQFLRNGRLIDKPDWQHGLFDVSTKALS